MINWGLVLPVIAGGIRSVAGWLENAAKDGKIDRFEWGKLLSSILQVGVLSFAAMYGLDLDPASASGLGVLGSFLLSAIKKAGKQ